MSKFLFYFFEPPVQSCIPGVIAAFAFAFAFNSCESRVDRPTDDLNDPERGATTSTAWETAPESATAAGPAAKCVLRYSEAVSAVHMVRWFPFTQTTLAPSLFKFLCFFGQECRILFSRCAVRERRRASDVKQSAQRANRLSVSVVSHFFFLK